MFLGNVTHAQDVIYYGGDNQSYNYQMLQHALSYQKSANYLVKTYSSFTPKLRAYIQLSNQEGIDVVFGGATIERERLNHPIRIPLLKGLNGWRIPLINKNNPSLFANLSSTEEFKQLLAGQFHLWSDVAILQSNNINVHKATHAEGMYQMLHKGRFDYFPRSILEVWFDFERHKDLDIMIDQHTLIHYPSAYYFYVNHQNTALIKDITSGLESAIKDGSFDELFIQHYGEVLQKVNLTPRKTYNLANPNLPPKTPLSRKELWLNLDI
ncbi:transporter substrate-binding domain-containing protein [Paraglaciecola aquimarina]|uniref:Transporter substrate-binding domain-containing protein n=1 Tax=Paraglaciecola algarum TaxID=3050085 RepID=A0ABS9D4Q4_9ALTE|nr:transporter substrate-binding domain-containing protein [Paraglaciecola sp. G1-23]